MTTTSQVHRFTVNTDIYMLSKVQDWFESFQSAIPYLIWVQCNLVLVEAFTNVVEHAHQDLPPDTPIDIEFTIRPHEVELWVWDYGKPFDLKAQLEISLKKHSAYESIDEIPTGGRGLMIAHSIADTLLYERQPNQRNCFIFVKRFSATLQGITSGKNV